MHPLQLCGKNMSSLMLVTIITCKLSQKFILNHNALLHPNWGFWEGDIPEGP